MFARLSKLGKLGKKADDGVPARKPSHRRSLKLSQSERELIPALLEPYRYIAQDAAKWQTDVLSLQPCLQIRITSHVETKGHTYYNFDCSLTMSSKLDPYLSWRGKRRLQHLRRGLHDVSKRELGSSYRMHFKGVPFARHGGVRGTTKRLNTWCSRLADCINMRVVPPVVVAQTLKLLDAPMVLPSWTSHTGDGKAHIIAQSRSDGNASASTTDAECDGAASDCGSYESDFESEFDVSDMSDSLESIAEELPFPTDDLCEEDDVPIALYEPNCLQELLTSKDDPAIVPVETNSDLKAHVNYCSDGVGAEPHDLGKLRDTAIGHDDEAPMAQDGLHCIGEDSPTATVSPKPNVQDTVDNIFKHAEPLAEDCASHDVIAFDSSQGDVRAACSVPGHNQEITRGYSGQEDQPMAPDYQKIAISEHGQDDTCDLHAPGAQGNAAEDIEDGNRNCNDEHIAVECASHYVSCAFGSPQGDVAAACSMPLDNHQIAGGYPCHEDKPMASEYQSMAISGHRQDDDNDETHAAGAQGTVPVNIQDGESKCSDDDSDDSGLSI